MVRYTVLLQLLFLALLALLSSTNCSCCCGCCDCCGCCCDGYGGGCCCGCGGNRNSENIAAATAVGLAIGSAMRANTAQTAAVTPTNDAVYGVGIGKGENFRERPFAMGSEQLTNRTTGRRIEQQHLLDGIERGGNGGGLFFSGGRRGRRRASGVGRLDTMMDQLNFDTMFPGMGGSGSGTDQQSPFNNDPPGLGPGLLPDGSTGRRKSQHGKGFNNDFFGGMNFDGMHSPAKQRQKRSQRIGKRQCGRFIQKKCACEQHQEESDKRMRRCPSTKLKMVEIDPNLLRNYTVARFLIGLVPKMESQTKKADGTLTQQEGTGSSSPDTWSTSSPDNWSKDNSSPDSWPTDNPSTSKEIDTLPTSSSTASREEDDNSSSPQQQKQQRFRSPGPSSSSSEVDKGQRKEEDLITRRLFLIPPVGPINGRVRRKTATSADAAAVAPSSPLKFYKPMVPNPENADERLGTNDYD